MLIRAIAALVFRNITRLNLIFLLSYSNTASLEKALSCDVLNSQALFCRLRVCDFLCDVAGVDGANQERRRNSLMPQETGNGG